MNFLGDVSSDPVGAGSHLLETSFFLSLIWSLYPATFGQAIPSAFGLFRLAETEYEEIPNILRDIIEIQKQYKSSMSEVARFANESYQLNILDSALDYFDYLREEEFDYFLESSSYNAKYVAEIREPFMHVIEHLDGIKYLTIINNTDFPDTLFNQTYNYIEELVNKLPSLPKAKKIDKDEVVELHTQCIEQFDKHNDVEENLLKTYRANMSYRM